MDENGSGKSISRNLIQVYFNICSMKGQEISSQLAAKPFVVDISLYRHYAWLIPYLCFLYCDAPYSSRPMGYIAWNLCCVFKLPQGLLKQSQDANGVVFQTSFTSHHKHWQPRSCNEINLPNEVSLDHPSLGQIHVTFSKEGCLGLPYLIRQTTITWNHLNLKQLKQKQLN